MLRAQSNSTALESALTRAVELGEVGVQVAAYLDGAMLTEGWIGTMDPATGARVGPETLFPVFSVTKAVTATALHIQADRGLVDYDLPVAHYWPEFAAHGKGGITVRDVLVHRTGVPQMPADIVPERLDDWDWIVQRLADLTPLHAPGERSIYHAMSFGWLVGEIVRRTDPDARPFGRYVRDEICEPLGIDDLWIGLPASEEHRVATLVVGKRGTVPANPVRDLTMPPAITPGVVYNRPEVHAACNPGAGGIMNARSAARFFAFLACGGELDGVRLISEDRLRACTQLRTRPYEADDALPHVTLLGTGGYWAAGTSHHAPPAVGTGAHVLCHPGAGGSIAWADLDARLSVAITHNRMFSNDPPLPADEHPFTAVGDVVRDIADEVRRR